MQQSRKTLRKKRRKSSFLKKFLLAAFLLLVLMFGYGSYLAFQAYEAAQQSFNSLGRPGGKSILRHEAVSIGDDPISILLMGIEDYSSGGKNGRADTLIVVVLNPKTKKMTMVSIPRDTKVTLPEEKVGKYGGVHKINAAYTFGAITGYGANRLAVETVERLLDIPIDKYVAVGFKGFVEIVNALGGVELNVRVPFWEENIFTHERIYFEKGMTHLNGQEALAFVRMRKRPANVEYSRMERQRQFLKAALDKVTSAQTFFKIDEISDMLGQHVDTNLTMEEIYELQQIYASFDASSIRTLELNTVPERIDGKLYEIPVEKSLHEVKATLKQALHLAKHGKEQETS